MSWELDFWGRYRRMIESASANVDASDEDYNAGLVTLLADVATNYVQYRVAQHASTSPKRTCGFRKASKDSHRSGSKSAPRPDSMLNKREPFSSKPVRPYPHFKTHLVRPTIACAFCSACRHTTSLPSSAPANR